MAPRPFCQKAPSQVRGEAVWPSTGKKPQMEKQQLQHCQFTMLSTVNEHVVFCGTARCDAAARGTCKGKDEYGGDK